VRRGYLDWLRGLAVIVMIEAHTIDAWTLASDRQTGVFRWAIHVGGFGAPLFLFLAGVAVALSASAKERRGAPRTKAAAAVRRRGWEIFGLAFVFRLQSYLLSGGGSLRGLLKVDILNIMGPSIVAAAAVWGWCRRPAMRVIWLSLATVSIPMLTPIVREARLLDPLPGPVERYLRPEPGLTNFVMFPWAAFVFAGAAVGSLIDAARSAADEHRLHRALAAIGLGVAVIGYGTSFLPSIYARANFWTSSPTYFFLKLGIVIGLVVLAHVWERRPGARPWSPMRQLGRTSLFIYWVHVELVYGWFSAPLHRRLPVGRAVVAFAVFTVLMFEVSVLKARVAARWAARSTG
jgi:uncharacterized membrane protein